MHGDLSSPETTGEIRTAPQRSQNPTAAVWQAPSLAFKGRERLPTFDFRFTHYWEEVGRGSIEAKRPQRKDFVVLWRPSISGCARNATLVSYLRSGKPSGKSCVDISTL